MKRAVYFGTNGRPGHGFIPLYGKFSDKELRAIEIFVDGFDFEKLFTGGFRARWFNLEFQLEGNNYSLLGYAVPYSPDDKRGYSKTVILVEDGNKEDIRTLFDSNEFLQRQFNIVWNNHNYREEEKI